MPTFETTSPRTRGETVFSSRNKIGFVLALLLGIFDLPAVAQPTPDGEAGPPMAVLVLSSLCGLITLAAVAYGWSRRSWPAIRIGAGARIVSLLLAMPAFFVDGIEGWIRVLAAVFVLVTIVTVVLMLAPARRTADGEAAR
jgi:hypothetical protein